MIEELAGTAAAGKAGSLRSIIGRGLVAQVVWAFLSAIWNAVGAYLIANGQPALGPAASIPAAIILLAIGLGFTVSVTRWPGVYVLLSLFTGLLGLYAIANAFTANSALWPSEAWRLGGAALNSVAAACGLLAIVAYARWRKAGL